MKHTEETIDLRQSYDEIITLMQNDNYLLPPELLNDEQFFFHILKQGNAEILITFFEAAQNNGVSIKQIIEEAEYKTLRLAAENQNHQVMELLLSHADKNNIDIIEVLKYRNYILFSNAAQNVNHEVIKLLLEKGSDVGIEIKTILANKDYKLFHHAVENTNPNVIKLLFEHAKTLRNRCKRSSIEEPIFSSIREHKECSIGRIVTSIGNNKRCRN